MLLHKYPYALGLLKLYLYKLFMGGMLQWNGMPRLSVKASFRTRKGAKIELNRGSYFAEGSLLRVTENARFTIGKNSGFNSYCVITCRDSITIGDNVMFGPFVTMHDHDHVITRESMKKSGYATKPIVIEDDAWIGGNVVILKGVTIGKGAVIAAGAIITKDVPPYTVVYSKQNTVMKEIN